MGFFSPSPFGVCKFEKECCHKVGFPLSMLFKTWKLEKEFYKGASFLFPLLFHAYAFPFFMLG
jgi:hypothetical protein